MTGQALASAAPAPEGLPRIGGQVRSDRISYNQEQICLLEAFYPQNLAYNAQALVRVHGDLSVDILEKAVTHVVRRHEMLRTTIHLRGDGYHAVVHEPFHFEIPVHDLTHLEPGEQSRALDELLARRMGRAFDVGTLPLLSLDAVRLARDAWTLIQVEHHVVHDGWSFGRLWTEIQDAYNALIGGRTPDSPALPAQYQQFVAWQRSRMEGDYGRRALAFWERYLDGASRHVSLGSDGTGTDRLDGHNLELSLPADRFEQVRAAARRLGVSNFVVLFSTFAMLLAAKSGERDFCLGTAVSARTEPDIEPLIGMVVNTVPIRVAVEDGSSLDPVARHVQRSLFQALRYDDVPLSLIVRRLRLAQERGRNPLFQHCFSFHDSDVPTLRLSGAVGHLHEIQNQAAKFHVNVVVIPPGPSRPATSARMFWQFSRSLFSRDEAVSFTQDYEALLARALGDAG